jgi:hypothetical protein
MTQYRIAIWSQLKYVLGEHVKMIQETRTFIREIKTMTNSILSFSWDVRSAERRYKMDNRAGVTGMIILFARKTAIFVR